MTTNRTAETEMDELLGPLAPHFKLVEHCSDNLMRLDHPLRVLIRNFAYPKAEDPDCPPQIPFDPVLLNESSLLLEEIRQKLEEINRGLASLSPAVTATFPRVRVVSLPSGEVSPSAAKAKKGTGRVH